METENGDRSSPTSDASNNEQPEASKKRTSLFAELEVDLKAPEPPSKRARRAQKKGKPLPAKPDSGDDVNRDSENDEPREKSKARAEHSVWIGNLPFNITATELRKWLVDNSGGVITEASISRVKLPMTKQAARDKKDAPANKGFAYVDFNDLGPKVAAVALSETNLKNRKLLIKDATSFEGRPKKDAANAEPQKDDTGATGSSTKKKPAVQESRKIFIGNLGFSITEDDVWSHFSRCGEIHWVKIATFEDSGKCKGYGWVSFKEPEAAAWAVKGYVKIREAVDTEADFAAEAGVEEEDPDDGEDSQPKKFRKRKWWVNRMHGRELKIELAEDDQVRYRKRFRKGAPGKGEREERQEKPARRRPVQQDVEEPQSNGAADPAPDKPLRGHEDLMQARLMGVVAKPTGKKITFD